MQKRLSIKNLTVITVTVLTFIIILQVYWLITSYQHQKQRFKTDIQNALSAASVKTTMGQAFRTGDLAGMIDFGSLNNTIEDMSKELSPSLKEGNDKMKLICLSTSIQIKDSARLLKYLEKTLDSSKSRLTVNSTLQLRMKREDMKLYRNAYQKELASREINLPFELAVLNNQGHIYWASCDSNAFKKIPFKSVTDEFSQLPTSSWGLQAAFPDANLYLLRKMIWILSISFVLILIGAYSFYYLLVFFFTQKKLSDMRNDFMNNMTHELKTPITSVSVALEMVLDKSKELSQDKRNSYLVTAHKELKRLNLIIENTLKIISVERAEIQVVKEHIAVVPWLQNIRNSMTPLLEDKAVKLSISVEPETMECIGDRIHLTNVMYNIIENAIKYNYKIQPEIRIMVTGFESKVTIEITDNGEGIPSQYVSNIFDKFFRVPKGDLHDVKGHGLGLSYVKGIIEMHGGKIHVSSIPNEGSTFTIELPIN
jgi:two-component system phosphate regulon sensor histidine kinase PhoR